jgi:hypothetical protein
MAETVKLIRCAKCGTVITTQDTMVQSMMAEVTRLNQLAENDRKFNRGKMVNLYQQQSAQVHKLMKQILHMTAQMDEHARLLIHEKSVLTHYVRDNGLVSDETLRELELKARDRAAEANKKDQAKINELYGEFQSICQNRTKRDPTADKALKKV